MFLHIQCRRWYTKAHSSRDFSSKVCQFFPSLSSGHALPLSNSFSFPSSSLSLSQFNIAARSKSDAHKSVITNHVRCRRGQWHRQRRPRGSWERAMLFPPPFLHPPPPRRTSSPFSGASRSGNDSQAHYVLRGSGNSRDRNARRRSLASGNCILLFPAALRVLINTRVWIYAHANANVRTRKRQSAERRVAFVECTRELDISYDFCERSSECLKFIRDVLVYETVDERTRECEHIYYLSWHFCIRIFDNGGEEGIN